MVQTSGDLGDRPIRLDILPVAVSITASRSQQTLAAVLQFEAGQSLEAHIALGHRVAAITANGGHQAVLDCDLDSALGATISAEAFVHAIHSA